MKRTLITATMVITTLITASGQTQSPGDIARKWDEIQHLCEKYDDGADSAYRILQEQLTATKRDPVANAIWHSCMGQFLSDYCNGNRYRLRDRTEVAEVTPADFKEWDIRTFKRRVREEYLLSLKDAKALQAVDAKNYSALMFKMDKQLQVKMLYEVLAYRVINYLTSDLDDEAPDRSLSSDALWPNNQFLKTPLTITEESSVLQMVLSVYQDLTRHHIAQNHEMDLIMLTIERYDFMREQGLAPDNSLDWYITFLKKWAKECEQMEGYGLIAYKIGCLYLVKQRALEYGGNSQVEEADHDVLLKAESWLKTALNASGKSFYKENVNKAIRGLHGRTITASALSGNNAVFPTGSATLWRISYANCEQMHVKVVKATSASTGMYNDKVFEYVSAQKPVYEEVVELSNQQNLMTHSGFYLLPELPAGAYWLVLSDLSQSKWDDKTPRECLLFQICDIEVLPRNTDYGLEVLTIHRRTGEPLSNAKVTMTMGKQTATRITDSDGFCQFGSLEKNQYSSCDGFSVSWQGQTLLTSGRYNWWGRNRSTPDNHIDAHLFTDRSLYRPGQTVHFKGVFELVQKEKYSRLLAFTTVKVALKDVNFQQVEEMELRTNEFGSIAGEFTLPEGGLTGAYHIYVYVDKQSFSHTISVEEYKLPAFEVEIETPEETFSIGQEVTVKGSAMALAGYPLDHASVSYRVTRNASFPWWRSYWWRPTAEPRTVAYGTLQTDDDGNFRITFPTEEDMTLRKYTPLYRYEVSVDVTDINGETHSGRTIVYVSSRNLLLSCNLPGEIAVGKSENQYKISLTNTAGKPQSGTVGYELFRLQMPDNYKNEVEEKADVKITDMNLIRQQLPWLAFNGETKQENWPAVSLRKGTVDVNKDTAAYFSFPDFNHLPDGYYKLVLNTKDNNGNTIESEDYVHIYREESQQCSAYKPLWISVDHSVNIGDTLNITIGSILPEANVLFEIYSHNDKVCAEWVALHGNTYTITYPVTSDDLGGLSIYCLSVNQNKMEEETRLISVTDDKKDIRFEFLRFRDKTMPGSQEEYQVRLTDKDGKPVSAELLCSMYDMALDALGSHNNHSLSFFTPWNGARGDFHTLSWGRSFSRYNYRDYYLYYSLDLITNWLMFHPNACTHYYGYSKAMGVRGNREVVLNMVDDDLSVDFVEESAVDLGMVADEAAPEHTAAKAAGTGAEEPAEQIRTNFAETAFFYPQLRTDANGEIYISFTMPDALTKWKMQGVAHNPDLQYGRFEKFVQTAKDLMIVPNAPRFLREGDTMDFSAKVVNMSDKHLCGYVTLQMFNAVNNQQVAMIYDDGANDGAGRDAKFCVSTTEGSQQYDVPAGASQEIHFRIVVPEDVPAVSYRIIAHNTTPAEVAGDGEEKTLSVLTNRMMVTETMPFYISGKGSKTFTFTKLQNSFGAAVGRDDVHIVSTTLKHYRLTVECTPNPVWYAIQAMPYMMEYPHECNEQRFSRYYANALATHILKANPVIEEVFNHWQVESPDAFCSALEKNQELKSVVLEETPWVLDAQREGANKQALAAMFDFKRMAKEEAATLKKLQQAQNGDGGWPWFSGGKSSDFITRHIVAGFGHLKALGVSTDVANSTLRNAVSYMDAQMYQRYLDRKKYHYTYVDETHYLYARSFYKDKLSKQHQAAYDTAYKVLLSGWKSESYYTQAMIALTAWRNGDQQVAKEIVVYLKSMAQHNEEMGMFWKKQGGGWFWYEQPVERQAMLIEAFHTITPEDAESLAQMQLWLLKQKQTQHWNTTKSTTEAVYALLLNKTLVAEDKTVTVTIGNVRLPDETVQTEAGTGYFKKAWTGEEITADKANVRIEKGTDGPAWGGLYWQYFENLDKITRSDDKNLVIEKQLYKVENTDKGEVLKAITTNQPLQKGDKVRVRVVITCDRDMEFVHLKDMRAATFEPVNVFSQYKYQDGLWYYESTKDAATHFFIDWMPKGKYVFEYTLFATQSGDFSNGITHIECMYAPEFQSHSAGIRVKVR